MSSKRNAKRASRKWLGLFKRRCFTNEMISISLCDNCVAHTRRSIHSTIVVKNKPTAANRKLQILE